MSSLRCSQLFFSTGHYEIIQISSPLLIKSLYQHHQLSPICKSSSVHCCSCTYRSLNIALSHLLTILVSLSPTHYASLTHNQLILLSMHPVFRLKRRSLRDTYTKVSVPMASQSAFDSLTHRKDDNRACIRDLLFACFCAIATHSYASIQYSAHCFVHLYRTLVSATAKTS